jgi:hypothetical protein
MFKTERGNNSTLKLAIISTRFEREQREKNGLARPPTHRTQDEMAGSDDWGQGDKGTSVFSLLFCSKLVLSPAVELIC